MSSTVMLLPEPLPLVPLAGPAGLGKGDSSSEGCRFLCCDDVLCMTPTITRHRGKALVMLRQLIALQGTTQRQLQNVSVSVVSDIAAWYCHPS
jgi:hypothetical protein